MFKRFAVVILILFLGVVLILVAVPVALVPDALFFAVILGIWRISAATRRVRLASLFTGLASRGPPQA